MPVVVGPREECGEPSVTFSMLAVAQVPAILRTLL